MTKMKLTAAGATLLGTTLADGTPRYWIGYYGLAYVDRNKVPLAEAASTGLLAAHVDPDNPGNNYLGDYIYNIWQGDMVNGYAQNNPEDTAAATLFGLTMYDKSVRTNYRYVYKDGHNNLVAWKSISNGNGENTLERKGVMVYEGDSGSGSSMPVPAPLYYGGEPSDSQIVVNSSESESIPVSSDYRYYVGTRDSGPYGWKDSSDTQETADGTVQDADLLSSISNFNKFHGTVSSEGYGVSSVSSCHNMSRATKLFPISYYSVVNDNGQKLAETKYSDNSPARKPLATAVKFSIDLSPITSDSGYTALNYEADENIDDQDVTGKALFETKYVSFRFNRVGIYAVPMTVHRYSTDSSTNDCNLQKVQFEIDGDAEPILVAVADVNDTVVSDRPEEGGVAKFSLEFILKFGDGEHETPVENSTAVYYNLYENDATTWYKNQLLASASISEAVTDLSLEMNALKQHVNDVKECCAQDMDLSQYALKNHTHDYLKNLVDGREQPGAVRGIDTCPEGDGKNIVSIFGLGANAPEGTVKSAVLNGLSAWDASGTTVIPDSYLYGEGFIPSSEVPDTGCITFEQVKAIVSVMGARWLVDNVLTSTGCVEPGETDPDPDTLGSAYVWTGPDTYAMISVLDDAVENVPLDPGGADKCQAIVIMDAESEQMFADGYSAGPDSLVLGNNTAASGKCSLVQGSKVYTDSDFVTALGSDQVKVENSEFITVSGAHGFDIGESKDSILFGAGNAGGPGKLYTSLDNVQYSIVGGSFSGGENQSMCNGITTTIWLGGISEQVDPYGATGVVRGSVISGSVKLGMGIGGTSAENSVILHDHQSPDRRISGQVIDSVRLGDGYSAYLYGGHKPELDEKIDISGSIAIHANVHDYYDKNEVNYRAFKDQDFTLPSIMDSVVISANICKPVNKSFITADGTDVASISVNDPSIPTAIDTVSSRDIILGNGCRIGEGTLDSILIGGGMKTTSGLHAVIGIGDGDNFGHWFNDTAVPLDEFNGKVEGGTISDGRYVILGSGNLRVWDDDSGELVYTSLSGSPDGMYFGVEVSGGHPVYNPSMERIINLVDPSRSGEDIERFDRTVSVGSTRLNRMNAGAIENGVVIGGGNKIGCPGKPSTELLVIGEGNVLDYADLTNVAVIGTGNQFTVRGDMKYPYGVDSDGNLLYPTVKNVQIIGDGIELQLDSPDPYATHEFKDALVLLDHRYDLSVLSVYPHPVKYFNTPSDAYPQGLWTIGGAAGNYSTYEYNFTIDPRAFTNYRDAWAEIEPQDGTTIWQNFITTGNTVDPRWPEVTELAESMQSEDDVYQAGLVIPANDLHVGYRNPFHNQHRSDIRLMIHKPDAPMVYTGGIAIAGKPILSDTSGQYNYGLIKLGHVSKPVAYISTSPNGSPLLWNWSAFGNNVIQPISITGTTTCPYGGRSLMIDGTQELDGTMHLVLSNTASMMAYATQVQSVDTDATIVPTKDYIYRVNIGDNVTVEFTMPTQEYLADGSEFMVDVQAIGTDSEVTVMSAFGGDVTLESGKMYLIRKVTASSGVGSKYMIIPIYTGPGL